MAQEKDPEKLEGFRNPGVTVRTYPSLADQKRIDEAENVMAIIAAQVAAAAGVEGAAELVEEIRFLNREKWSFDSGARKRATDGHGYSDFVARFAARYSGGDSIGFIRLAMPTITEENVEQILAVGGTGNAGSMEGRFFAYASALFYGFINKKLQEARERSRHLGAGCDGDGI